MFDRIKKIHMVGIGGSGMSGIAEVLINLGYKVSGSDLLQSETTTHLIKMGARINFLHRAKNVSCADVVVTSTAIRPDNPEVITASKNKIPIIPRAEMLSEIARLKYTVSVAGTHGKTTTTSLVALVLQEGGLDPTVIIGGRLKNFGTGAKLGRGKFLVAEADESDGSFLKLQPTVAVVTNIDDDHLDFYKTMECLKDAFVEHINKVPFYGCAILCADDPGVRTILKKIERKFHTYGLSSPAGRKAFSAKIISNQNTKTSFEILHNEKRLGMVTLKVPGMHNVRNALAAAGCGIILDVPFGRIAYALKNFEGVGRRLEIRGSVPFGSGEIKVIDDYGHHPTEIKTTLKTLKEWYPQRRLVVVFQPHRYTRTKILYKKFASAFGRADLLQIMDIYPAGEKPLKGVSSDLIINEMRKKGRSVEKYNLQNLLGILRSNDIVVTLGAGDVWKTGEEILWYLRR
ncbi:MAG: UDP-N-acetylmuramate--L-alanine ligase [Elusimicrobiota bacterium]